MYDLKEVIHNVSSFSIWDSDLAYIDQQSKLFFNSDKVLENVVSVLVFDSCIAVNFSNCTFEIFEINSWKSIFKNQEFGFISTNIGLGKSLSFLVVEGDSLSKIGDRKTYSYNIWNYSSNLYIGKNLNIRGEVQHLKKGCSLYIKENRDTISKINSLEGRIEWTTKLYKQIYHIIGANEESLFVHCTKKEEIFELDNKDGKTKNRWKLEDEYLDLFPVFSKGNEFLSENTKLITSLSANAFWEWNWKENKINKIDHTDYFKENEIDVFGTAIQRIGKFLFLGSRYEIWDEGKRTFKNKIFAYDISTNTICWEHLFNLNRVSLMTSSLYVNDYMMAVKDSEDTLYIFKKV